MATFGLEAIVEPDLDERSADSAVDELERKLSEAEELDIEADVSRTGGGRRRRSGGGEGDGLLGDLAGEAAGGGVLGKLAKSGGTAAGGGAAAGAGGAAAGGGAAALGSAAAVAAPVALAGAVGVGILKGLESASGSLEGTLGLLGTALKLFFQPFGRALSKIIRPALKGLLSFVVDFNKWANNNIEIIETFLSVVSPIIGLWNVTQKIWDWFQATDISGAIDSGINALQNWWSDNVPSASEIQSAVGNALSSLEDWFSTNIGNISSWLQTGVDNLQSLFEGFSLDGIKRAIINGLSSVNLPSFDSWSEFIPNMNWRFYVNSLNWYNWVSSLNWRSWVSNLRWSSWLDDLDWWRYLDDLYWSSWLDDLDWWRYVDDINWWKYIPDVDWSDFIPDAPSFASGGVVNEPTAAMVGEREPEVILPFSKVGSFVSSILSGKGPRAAGEEMARGSGVGDADLSSLSGRSGTGGMLGGSGGGGGQTVVREETNQEQVVERLDQLIERVEEMGGDIVLQVDGKELAKTTRDSRERYISGTTISE